MSLKVVTLCLLGRLVLACAARPSGFVRASVLSIRSPLLCERVLSIPLPSSSVESAHCLSLSPSRPFISCTVPPTLGRGVLVPCTFPPILVRGVSVHLYFCAQFARGVSVHLYFCAPSFVGRSGTMDFRAQKIFFPPILGWGGTHLPKLYVGAEKRYAGFGIRFATL